MNKRPILGASPARGEAGNAILEFAIILPMLFMLVLGTVEYTQLFRLKEFQTLVTREAASLVYRECFQRGDEDCFTDGFLNIPGTTTDRLDTCLKGYREAIDEEISDVLTGVDLTIGFHEYIDNGDGTFSITTIGHSTRYDSNVLPTETRYVDDPVAINRDFGDMIRNNDIIVTAESFIVFPFTLINVFVPELRLYHVTAH